MLKRKINTIHLSDDDDVDDDCGSTSQSLPGSQITPITEYKNQLRTSENRLHQSLLHTTPEVIRLNLATPELSSTAPFPHISVHLGKRIYSETAFFRMSILSAFFAKNKRKCVIALTFLWIY